MRALLYQALMAEDSVHDPVDGRIYQSGSLGQGNTPAEPKTIYLLITELPSIAYPEVRETSPGASSHMFQVWAYDRRGDMLDIDSILGAVRDTVVRLAGQVSPTGARCSEAKFLGFSQDIVDQNKDLSSRYALVRLSANK